MLLILEGAPLTFGALAMTLYQIVAMPDMGLPAINVVYTVSFLLKEVEPGVVVEEIRDITNLQFNELTSNLREFMDRLKEKVMEELEKKTAELEKKTAELAEVVEKVAKQAGNAASSLYRDMLIRAVYRAPLDTNPRLAAKESIRQRQSLIDLPKGSGLRDCTNLTLVGKFSEAMGRVTGQQHKIWSAFKLKNGGILVEMVTDKGVLWIASKANAEAFLQEMGESEASFKTRSFNIITYYMPLSLDTNNNKDRREIEEMNGILRDRLTKLRWIKPLMQRWSSYRCPTDSCQIPVIPVESSGIWRNQIWQRHQPK